MSDAMRKISVADVVIEASAKQRIASDPEISAWVSASAGSGKTKVLTDRLLRLLLPREDGRPGTKPEKILALTYTKAGANEMSLRLSKRLSKWAIADDDKLAKDMEENLLGRVPTQAEMHEARKLFARVVDAPGGLKIMTIHSFCQSVLGRFPVEAGIAPNFKPLDDMAARELRDQAKSHILSHASTDTLSPLGRAVTNISTMMSEDQFLSALSSIISERHQLEGILKRTFGADGLYTLLCARFKITPNKGQDEALRSFCSGIQAHEQDLWKACGMLSESSKKDQDKAAYMRPFLEADTAARPSLYKTYTKAFITEGRPKKDLTNSVKTAWPDIESVMLAEAERIMAFEDEHKAIACASLTRDLILLGTAILESYQRLKEEQSCLDFDDMILKTLSLLKGDINNNKNLKISPWILYKLDGGLDHLLIDEAQDTNPEQWDIIKALTDDFFNGQGATETPRTIFVVGDEKQSIFSFQRAAPKKFGEMQDWYQRRVRESGQKFEPVDINTSFRSVPVILEAVDKVFGSGHVPMGITSSYLTHTAMRQGQGGVVELWPLYETIKKSDQSENGDEKQTSFTGWELPDKLVTSQSGSEKMAQKIGDTIQKWIETNEILESYGRPIRPGDIMILVHSRKAIVNQIVRALKERKIAVSGVDRMVLNDQIVVQDLCALASFALQPDDDLTLASILKSPLVGLAENALYDLSVNRDGSLWNAVRKNADAHVIAWLQSIIERAGRAHPYEFFSQIVQEPCPADSMAGRKAIHRRLGHDAMDPLDEFLHAALAYETLHHGGLEGFLKHQRDGHTEVKRELEEAGDAVRIMTVHGSKGLQAPIVFMPDTVRPRRKLEGEKLLWPNKSGMDVPVFNPSKPACPSILSSAQEELERKMDEEYRRLLYVAMTRAEERLYVGAYVNKQKPGKEGKTPYWHEDIRMSFENDPACERIPSGLLDDEGKDIPVLRLSEKSMLSPDKISQNKEKSDIAPTILPAWIYNIAPEEPTPPKPLVPSRPSAPEPAAASPLAASDKYRFKRGNITHKLMQLLPDLRADQRRSAATKFLARTSLQLPQDLQDSILNEVMAILEDPAFQAVFGPDSMAEVPITGLLDGKILISGQIDRILIGDRDILILDYKTNRPPPKRVEDVPDIYRRQMSAYADTIRQIYPEKAIRAALLWTMDARLMEIPV